MRYPSSTTYYTFPKNRYGDVLPCEDSRVVLDKVDDVDGSDYINANWINGEVEGSTKRYIACQAPLPTTIVDFWRMIFQVECSVIVMLTKLMERGRLKAHRYYPDEVGSTQQFGQFTVTLVKAYEKDSIQVRTLKLALGKKEERTVTQLHYSDWPDFGTPENTQPLRTLISLTDMYQQLNDSGSPTGPIVSHCSAGLGRTGTFIAAHIILTRLQRGLPIDIHTTVALLRKQRDGMVQTKEQYYFIYQTIAEMEDEIEEIDTEDVEMTLATPIRQTPRSCSETSHSTLSSPIPTPTFPPVLINSHKLCK